jgi:hypothetical protein
MTDFEDDELASAYLDDATTAAERARVDSDPALRARVDELRAVRDALAGPIEPPTTVVRDRAVRAALDSATVVELRPPPAAPRWRVASIAAAILVVLVAAGLLVNAQRDSTTSSTALAPVSSSLGAASERSAAAAGGPAVANSASTSRPALGSFADRDSLVQLVRTTARDRLTNADHTPPSSSTTASAAAAPAAGGAGTFSTTSAGCAVSPPATAPRAVYSATAVLEQRPVQLDVFANGEGNALVLVVTDATTCTELFTLAL